MCEVQDNCLHHIRFADVCWRCDDYKLYRPIDNSILSPIQIQKREERKIKKKNPSEASKRGKAAKRKGSRVELDIVKMLKGYIKNIRKTPLSGALDYSEYKGDLVGEIDDRKVKFEVKARKDGFKFLYNNLEKDNVNYLVVKADRRAPLVIMSIDEFKLLLPKVK